MLVTIHMKSGKSLSAQATVDQAPVLVSRLSSIMGGSYGQATRADPGTKSFALDLGVNCDKITVAGINYRGRETSSIIIVAAEVEFVQYDAPISQVS